jgi:para-aminobenzoate synthetase/4-amino-4-deoxychorismate lyase
VWFPGSEPPRCFRNPRLIVTAHRVEDVWPALQEVERHVANGLTAAGYVAYEAAPAFDRALRTHAPGLMPLLWFGLYAEVDTAPLPSPLEAPALQWQPMLDAETHARALDRIRDLIAAGDTYQVNYTFPLRAPWQGDALLYFAALHASQPTPLAACINTGPYQVLSLSPELFFTLDGDNLTTRPMKGTRLRGRYPEEDATIARELADSAKDQAENVMITDLLRNDLGRIARTGSVSVPGLFTLERYPTVWQLTSTIEAQSDATVPEIFRALFPCGSVTGAPKIRAMEIIREIEPEPRGVYCGAIGWWEPGRRASFNVAIRTLAIDTAKGEAAYHTGSGITWDSRADDEYAECLQKTLLLTQQHAPFELLETLLFDKGYRLLDRHLDRIAASADYFGIPFDRARAIAALTEAGGGITDPRRIRLLWSQQGTPRVEVHPLSPAPDRLRVRVATGQVNSRDVFLFHKTTRRDIYITALQEHPDCDEVLLCNERDEVTEGCYGNVVVTLDGRDYTPPVHCGLLAGCERAELLERGDIEERVIHRDELHRAERIRLINSVRGIMDADLLHP